MPTRPAQMRPNAAAADQDEKTAQTTEPVNARRDERTDQDDAPLPTAEPATTLNFCADILKPLLNYEWNEMVEGHTPPEKAFFNQSVFGAAKKIGFVKLGRECRDG